MAWVQFPDCSRRKIERIDRAEAERDLAELFGRGGRRRHRRLRLATFDEVMDDWVAADCPKATVSRNSRRRGRSRRVRHLGRSRPRSPTTVVKRDGFSVLRLSPRYRAPTQLVDHG
jgi:hypothetical protein